MTLSDLSPEYQGLNISEVKCLKERRILGTKLL